MQASKTTCRLALWALALLTTGVAQAQTPAPTPSYTTIQNGGTPATQRRIANFSGALQAIDNSGALRTDVTIKNASVTNAMLVSPSLTVSTTGPLSGGGSVALGATLALSCPTCLNASASAIGDIFYSTSGGSALTALSDVSAGSYLRSGGIGAAPLWSTLKLPNAATTGDLLYASGANTIGNLADVASGSVLLSGGVGSAPVWGSIPSGALPNTGPGAGAYNWATGDSLTLDAQGRVTAITNVTRTLTGGTGINAIGNLSADRTISINQAFAPTWTGVHTFQRPSIGVSQSMELSIQNTTSAGLGSQQYSPVLELQGQGFDSTASASKAVKFGVQTRSVQAAGDPSGDYVWWFSSNGGSYSEVAHLKSVGALVIGGNSTVGPSASQQHTLPAVTSDTFALLAATQTLTNKTISGSSNTLTNIANGSLTNSSVTLNTGSGLSGGAVISLGGSATLSIDQAFSPTWTGTHLFSTSAVFGGSVAKINNAGGTANAALATTATSNRTVTFPDASITVVGQSNTQTLTNKTIDGGSNTLTNIANGSLVNSSVTVNTTAPVGGGGALSLGGALTLTCTSCLTGTPAATGDLMYSTAGGQAMTRLADVALGSYLRSGGIGAAPVWSTLTLPNAATTGDILFASGSNAIGNLADVATGSVLISGGVGTAPSWGTVPSASLPNVGTAGAKTFATGDSITTDAQGRVSASSTVTRTLTAGAGLTGGGTLAADRTFAIDYTQTPTWTGAHIFTSTITQNIASVTGQQAAHTLKATTLATSSGTQSNSPGLVLTSQHWDTTALAGQPLDWMLQAVPNTAASPIAGQFSIYRQKNGGGWTEMFRISDSGSVLSTNAVSAGLTGTGNLFGATVGPNTPGTQLNIGVGTNASQVNVGHSGIATIVTGDLTQSTGAVSLTGNASSSFTTSSGNTTIDSAGVLQLASSTATQVTLGRTGINVIMPGGVLRASTPGANTAGVNFSIGLNNGGNAGGGLAAGAAGANTYTSGQGGAATTTAGDIATAGGATTVSGGKGGTGAASVNGPANGGNYFILGGPAGDVTSGFSGANGGGVFIRGGALSGTGTTGSVTIGDTNTAAVVIGNDAITYGTGTSTQKLILGAQQATANTTGASLVLAASGGGNSNGSGAAGTGGQGTFRGANGGAGSGAQNPGNGGLGLFTGGAAGGGGSGNASGGDARLDGASAQGSGTAGVARVGDITASAVVIGRSGITTTLTGGFTQLTGAFSLTANGASTLTTTSGNLEVSAAGTANIGTTKGNTVLGRSAGVTTITGGSTSSLDLSAGSGIFSTSTGTNTLGGNTVLADGKTLTASRNGNTGVNAWLSAQNTTAASLTINTSTGAITAQQMQWAPGDEMLGHGWGFRPATVGNATRASNVVTVTTTTPNTFVSGQYVYLYLGDGNFSSATYGPITVSDSTHFTYAQTAANAGPSGGFTWSDASGKDETVKVTALLRPSVGTRFQDTLADAGTAAPELVYYRSSVPNNGAYGEWFKFSALEPSNGNAPFSTTGGVSLRTVQSDGTSPGSFLTLRPGNSGGGFVLSDDVGNNLTSYPYNYGGGNTPNATPFVQSSSSLLPGSGLYMGYAIGFPQTRWYDGWFTRGNFLSIGNGDVASLPWGAPTTQLAGWAATSTSSVYGYYQNGGAFRLQALPAPSSVTVTPVGTTGATSRTYLVAAIDNFGNTTLATSGVTSSSNASLTAANYNTISWTAIPGTVRYDVYITSVSISNILGSTTSTSFNDTIGSGNSNGRYTTPGAGAVFAVPSNSMTSSGGTGSALTYFIYPVDADGHIGPPTSKSSVGTPSLSNPVTLGWNHVGGTASYLIARGTAANIVGGSGFQPYSGGTITLTITVPNAGMVRTGGNTVTVTIAAGAGTPTQNGHGLRVGDSFILTSADANFASGTYTVVTAPSATQFTYSNVGSNVTSANVAITYTGPQIAWPFFSDYGYSTRTLGAATRNTTADMILDGQLQVNAQTAGNAMVHTGNASNSSSQEVWKDSAGAAHFGVDAYGFPSYGNRFEFRENWLMGQNMVSGQALAVFTGGIWKYDTTANATGFTNTTGFAAGSPLGSGISLGTGTANTNGTRIVSTAGLFNPAQLNNLYAVAEFPAVLSAVGANNYSVFVGLTNANIANTHPGGYYFSKASTDTNWQCRADDGTTTTTVSSGVAPVAGTVQMMRIEYYGSGTVLGAKTVVFRIDGAVVATITTNVYSGNIVTFQAYATATNTITQQSLALGPLLVQYNIVATPVVP